MTDTHKNAGAMLDALGRIGNFAYEGGRYLSPCYDCGCTFDGAKLARQCLPCAVGPLLEASQSQGVDEAAVERVARALWDSEYPTWPEGYAANRETRHLRARAAIAALPRSRGEERMRAALEKIAAREDYSPGETEIRAIAIAALTDPATEGKKE